MSSNNKKTYTADEVEALKQKIYLATGEVEALYGLGRSWLATERMKGTGPKHVSTGENSRGKILYPKVEIEEWLEQHKVAK